MSLVFKKKLKRNFQLYNWCTIIVTAMSAFSLHSAGED